MADVSWVLDLARIAGNADKADIGSALGWPSVTPALRKVLTGPEEEDAYSRLEVQAMQQALEELAKEDPQALRAVRAFLGDEGPWLEGPFVRGVRWLQERVNALVP